MARAIAVGSRDLLNSFLFAALFTDFYDRLVKPYLGKVSIKVNVMKAIASSVNDFKKVI